MKLPIDHPLIINILFHPRKSFNESTENDLLITVDDGVRVGIRTYLKDKAYPTIIHFHGNAELAEEYQFFADILHQNKINLICCDYRGYGHSNGQSLCSNLMDDSLKIFKYIKK